VMTEKVIQDLALKSGEEVSVLVNGMGATPAEELFILYNKIHEILSKSKIKIYRVDVGEYATSLEMAGASLSLLRMNKEFEELMDAPAFSPFLPQWKR
jgi:dihydroxyacetone kinase-like protein